MVNATEAKLPEGFHENSVIMEVPLVNDDGTPGFGIDRSYQRDPSQNLVDEIAENWDEVASELVLVANRGERDPEGEVKGGLWLVNGQHRSLAARKRNHKTIWARVVDLSGFDDPAAVEAALRLKLNVGLPDRPLERFKAQLRAGDEGSLAIVEMLGRFDTQINPVPSKDGGINAVSAVEAIYRVDEGALLYDTIALLKDSYDHLAGRTVSAGIMRAVAWFIEKHAFETDRYRVTEKLRITGMEALHRRAITFQSMMGGSIWMNYYRAMIDLYNEKLTDKNKIEVRLRGAGGFGDRKSPTLRWHSKQLGDL